MLPRISSERCVVEGIKAVVVGDGDICLMFQQQGQHVIPLLTDGIM